MAIQCEGKIIQRKKRIIWRESYISWDMGECHSLSRIPGYHQEYEMALGYIPGVTSSVILIPGYRNGDNGKSDNVGRTLYSWKGGSGNAVNAPYAGHNHDGNSNSNNDNRQNALCLVASFGERTSYFLWIIMFSLADIFTAYYDCRANKRNTIGALEFELHYEGECIKLYDEIMSRRYVLQPSTAFIVRDPVQREIFASHFRDRVVHHLIARRLTPVLERTLTHDVYSSRKGKGTHYGIKRVDYFMRSCSHNYSRDAYVLKLDISGFFMSIDREVLWGKIETLICHPECSVIANAVKRSVAIQVSGKQSTGLLHTSQGQKPGIPPDEQEMLLYLIRTILFTDVKRDVRIVGTKEDWVGLPRNKSLFYAKKGCGLPIGNLTSQLFANIYMHEFDTWVKKTLKIRYYGRYVDDFFLIHTDPEYLKSCISKIRDFLSEQLGLTLHPKKIYFQHINKGVLFLGTFIKPWRQYIGKRTKGNFDRLIRSINTRISDPTLLSDLEQDRILAQMNSYLGLLSHTQSYRLRSKMMGMLDERFLEYFHLDEAYIRVLVKK